MSVRFALLVGVSDYSAFDRSADQPRGTSDLFGPPQNLAAMWDFCMGLGFSAADVGVLSSPLAPPRAGHPAIYATATRQSVLDGVRVLAERLASSEQSQGLLYFSGHGDEREGIGPVLCTEDTVACGEDLEGAVTLVEIAAILERHAPGHSVTVILDSCRSGVPATPARRSLGVLRSVARLRDHDTLISATGPGGTGVEVQVGGAWHGALTWALTTAAAPYVRRVVDGFGVLDLSVGSWVERARLLLDGYSVSQRPHRYGAALPVVLQPSGVAPITPTNRIADQRRGDIEIYGDESGQITGDEQVWVTFTIRDGSSNSIGKLVTSYQTPPTTMAPYADFWSWSGTAWPANFRLDYDSTGTVGQTQPPTGLPNPHPMRAFTAGLTQSSFGSHATSGFDVWGISETSVPDTFLGYLLRDPSNGGLKWLVTWPGYSQRGRLLADLPSPGGNGGVEIDDDSGLLYFSKISSPPSQLSGVVVGYNVAAAYSG